MAAPSNAWHAHLMQTYRSSNVPFAEAMKLASATYRADKNRADDKSLIERQARILLKKTYRRPKTQRNPKHGFRGRTQGGRTVLKAAARS